jgi:MFS family permease
MIAAGVGSVVLALVQSDDWGWGDTRTLVAMALGGILLAGVVVRSLHHPRPIIDLGLYRFGSFRTANVAITCFALSFFTMQFAAVQYLTEVWGYEIRDAGLLSAPVFFLTGITGPIAGRLADRHGPVRVVTSGTLAWAAIVAVLWSVVGTEPAPGTWLAFSVTGGIGAGLFWGAILTLTAQDLTTANFAQASGLNQTLQNLGNVFAIALTITLLGSEVLVDDFDAVFGLVVGAALAAFAVLLTGRATPART